MVKKLANVNRVKRETSTFTRPEGAGNFDNMDDKNIVDQINIKIGTSDLVPTLPKHLVNKEYVDNNSAAPAGSEGEIQFNEAGAFAADSNLFWNNVNKRLGLLTNGNETQAFEMGYDGHAFPHSQLRMRMWGNASSLGDYRFIDMYIKDFGEFVYDGTATRVTFQGMNVKITNDREMEIGTDNNYKLKYNSAGQFEFRSTDIDGIGTNGNVWTIKDGTDDVIFNGNVGIGTNSPQEKLDVEGNVAFNNFKSIEMVCDNGATLPGTPTTGQWFLHTPTGRNVLMQYNGSSWIPLHNIGSTTLYVDDGAGTDDSNNGGASGASAFATIQFAIDSLAGTIGGNVIINVAAGTYSELITIQGKSYAGAFSITLNGELTAIETNTQTSASKGNSANQGYIEDTGDVGAWSNLLLYSSNNDQHNIIDSVTANRMTIVNIWRTAEPTGDYTVYDWGTTVSNIIQVSIVDQTNVNFVNFSFVGSGFPFNVVSHSRAGATYTRCKFDGDGYQDFLQSTGIFTNCYFSNNGLGRVSSLTLFSSGSYIACKLDAVANNETLIQVGSSSNFQLTDGTIIDGNGNTGTTALIAVLNAVGNAFSFTGKNRIRNHNVGLSAATGGKILLTSGITYINNNTDESADAASFGFID